VRLALSFVAFAASSFWFHGFDTDVTLREIAWSRFAQDTSHRARPSVLRTQSWVPATQRSRNARRRQ
jgi:hypothetical protein